MKPSILPFIVGWLCLTQGVFAQNPIHSTFLFDQDTLPVRPEIGLVLSGGAAKGLSQIGVLKVLESQGIYPDLITGCSIGGLVGGLYAIGYSPEEMDSILHTMKWSEIFSDDIPLNRIRINEKRDFDNNMLKLQFDWDQKPTLPLSLVHGQNITELIGSFTWHASGISDFDSLRFPYRSAAVDLVNSQLFYFSEGDIKTAIRSTIAIPSIFFPVILDSMMMVDGGILCNFPVTLAKDLGAEYIIGVYTSYNEHVKLDEINSLLNILSRSAFITGVCDARKQLGEVDLLIRPDLGKHSAESFQKGVDIMNIGEAAAMEKIDTLKALATYLEQFPERKRREIPRIDTFFITEIGAEGNDRIKEDFILAWAGMKPNTWVSYSDVREAVRKIYSTLNFDLVDYLLRKTGNGYKLVFNVIESKPGLLGIGAHYDNDFKTGILLEAQYRNLLVSADRIYAGINISQNAQMRTDYTLYFGKKKRSFTSLQFYAENTDLPHYYVIDTLSSQQGKIRQSLWNVEYNLGIMLGVNAAIKVKGRYEWMDYGFSEGLEDWYGMEHIREHSLRAGADVNLNTLDKSFFPEKGMKLDARADFVFSDSTGYLKLYGYYQYLIKLHDRLSAGLEASSGWISSSPLLYDRFYLGGDHFLPRFNMVPGFGLGVYSLNVSDYASIILNLQFNIKTDFYLMARGSLFSLGNFNNSGTNHENSAYGYGLTAGYRSRLGPIKISLYTNSKDRDIQWMFNFSYPL